MKNKKEDWLLIQNYKTRLKRTKEDWEWILRKIKDLTKDLKTENWRTIKYWRYWNKRFCVLQFCARLQKYWIMKKWKIKEEWQDKGKNWMKNRGTDNTDRTDPMLGLIILIELIHWNSES